MVHILKRPPQALNDEWDTNKNADYDYGVLMVPSSIGAATGSFGWTTSISTSTAYILSGYPYIEGNATYNGRQMRTGSGRISSGNIYTRRFVHGINCSPGVSGAPVYSSDQRVIGIHTWGYNEADGRAGGDATKITSSMASFIRQCS